MADSLDVQKQLYPLPVYNFRVTVDGVEMSFAEVSGITVSYETLSYRHGLSFWEGEGVKTFRYDAFVPVTLRRGTVLGGQPLFLFQWITQRDSRPLEVSLCDERGGALISWRAAKAIPVKLEAPAFQADSNEAAIQTLELKASSVSVIEH